MSAAYLPRRLYTAYIRRRRGGYIIKESKESDEFFFLFFFTKSDLKSSSSLALSEPSKYIYVYIEAKRVSIRTAKCTSDFYTSSNELYPLRQYTIYLYAAGPSLYPTMETDGVLYSS